MPVPVPVVKLEVKQEQSIVQILEAIPIPSSVLIAQEISVQDVAPMEIFLEGDWVPGPVRDERQEGESEARGKLSIREVAPPTVRKTDEIGGEDSPVQPLARNPIRDVRKTVSFELNAGKKLHSRNYIRGVLHPQPVRVWFGALISVVTLMLLPATFVAGGLMLAKYSLWFAVIPAAFLLFGILYFIYARGIKCRICGQPLFSPKACHRHPKAHRIPILGYILPTSIHMLFFHWFRCMYCGTSVRMKE